MSSPRGAAAAPAARFARVLAGEDEHLVATRNQLLRHLLPYTKEPMAVIPVFDPGYLQSLGR